MIIVAGSLHVDPADRDAYLATCVEVVGLARAADGCLDYGLSPDLLEPGRINVYERWESDEQLLAFRGAGEPPADAPPIRGAEVARYRISAVEPP